MLKITFTFLGLLLHLLVPLTFAEESETAPVSAPVPAPVSQSPIPEEGPQILETLVPEASLETKSEGTTPAPVSSEKIATLEELMTNSQEESKGPSTAERYFGEDLTSYTAPPTFTKPGQVTASSLEEEESQKESPAQQFWSERKKALQRARLSSGDF